VVVAAHDGGKGCHGAAAGISSTLPVIRLDSTGGRLGFKPLLFSLIKRKKEEERTFLLWKREGERAEEPPTKEKLFLRRESNPN